MEIRLTSNGTWLADGEEITREQTLKLFARSIHRDEAGYYLKVGRETARIIVEDTPYFIESVSGDPEHGFQLRIRDGSMEPLQPETLEYSPGRLVCRIKGNTETARFLHAPYHDFLKWVEHEETGYFLRVGQTKIKLL